MTSILTAESTPFSSLGLYTGRITGPVVGRTIELAALEQGLASARRGMNCITLEGEPGIGKTRLVLAVHERAVEQGFRSIAVTADEEIRGPFLLARSIFSSAAAHDSETGSPAAVATERLVDALSSRDADGIESLPADQRLLRIYDL